MNKLYEFDEDNDLLHDVSQDGNNATTQSSY